MAHVSSRSFQDPDGIFLYQMDERGNRIRRIGGPYPSTEAADRASRAVSAEMGERPVEGYTERLRQTNPGVVGGQSPIPDQYRQYTPPGQPGLLDEPGKMKEKETGGSVLDWLIPTAEGSETTGFLSSGQSGLLSTDALQETRDRKLSPVEQLADTEFRAQLNPQGIARYSDAYRNPTKHTGLAYTDKPTSQRGFYMDTPTATSESLWEDKARNEIFEPGQVFRHGKSYQITGNLGLEGQGPEDVLHHEAAHDAMTKASSLESHRAGFLDFDIWLDLASLEHGRKMGIDLQEALTRHHDIKYPKSEMAKTDAELWLKAHIKHSRTEADKEGSHPFWTRYWEILVNELPKFYDALTESARKRHEALGYK